MDKGIQVRCWKHVRERVNSVNSLLVEIIDELNPDDSFHLVEVAYQYGDLIIQNGVLHLPSKKDNALLPIGHPDLSKNIVELLSYQAIPLFLSVENDNEVFVDTGSRVVPLNLFHAGNLLGLFESTDCIFGKKSNPIWNVSAGARSIILLPKITDNLGLKKLRSYYDLPNIVESKALSDHWNIFKRVAHHRNFSQPWTNTLLFFSKKWLSKDFLKRSPRFMEYILEKSWAQAQFAMGKIELALSWEKFAEAISYRNLKPRPYLSDQAKHLLSLAVGKAPGFRPADTSQSAAPVHGLQRAIVEVYGLKKYAPLIMHVYPFDTIHQALPIYYSLSYPILLEGSPLNKSGGTIMTDIRDMKMLIDTFKQYAEKSEFKYNFIHHVEFNFFHSDEDPYKDTISSHLIPKMDKGFLMNSFQGLAFPFTSAFWKGCIGILVKKIKP